MSKDLVVKPRKLYKYSVKECLKKASTDPKTLEEKTKDRHHWIETE